MHYKTQKAFTMVELIFVIIIIGILSAIAIPKFSETANVAYLSKGKSVLATVMSAMATERQKRILKGKTTNADAIKDLGSSTYAFYKFDTNQSDILAFPEKNCANGETGCWSRSNNGKKYVYKFVDSADGDAKFKILKNKLVCDSDTADCDKLLY